MSDFYDLLLKGKVGELSGEWTLERVREVFGPEDDASTSKKQVFLHYGSAELMFLDGYLRQVTVRFDNQTAYLPTPFPLEGIPESDDLHFLYFQKLFQSAGVDFTLKDEVLPFFRCYQVEAGGKEEVYMTFSPEENDALMSVGVVFAQVKKTHPLTLHLDEELYNKLSARSQSTRLSIEQIALEVLSKADI